MSKVPERPKGGKRTPFYWWRRFKSHKNLPYRATLINKIRNGDFEYPILFKQADWELEWMKQDQKVFIKEYKGYDYTQDSLYHDIERRYIKRYNLLFKDAHHQELDRLNRLVENLSDEFTIKKTLIREWMDTFTGTTEQLYYYCARKKGININSKKILDNSWKQ